MEPRVLFLSLTIVALLLVSGVVFAEELQLPGAGFPIDPVRNRAGMFAPAISNGVEKIFGFFKQKSSIKEALDPRQLWGEYEQDARKAVEEIGSSDKTKESVRVITDPLQQLFSKTYLGICDALGKTIKNIYKAFERILGEATRISLGIDIEQIKSRMQNFWPGK